MINRLSLNRVLVDLLKQAFDASDDATAWQLSLVDADGREFEVVFQSGEADHEAEN
jgi:hypothetical protein